MGLEIKTGKQLYQEMKVVDTKIEQELEEELCIERWVSVESFVSYLTQLEDYFANECLHDEDLDLWRTATDLKEELQSHK